MIMFWLIIPIAFLVGIWINWRHKNKNLLDMATKIPGPPTQPFIGNALMFMCGPEELIIVIKELMTTYGNVIRFWLGPDLNIIVSNPDDIKLLLTNNKTSIKGPQYKYMADILGGGILSGSGAQWRKHRKIASPNYGKRAIESYGHIFNGETHFLLNTFRNICNETEVDIYKYIVQTTSWSVCQTLMGLTKEETEALPHLQTIIDETPRIYDIVFDRMTKWYLQIDPVFYLTRHNKELKQFKQCIKEFSASIIKKRLKKIATLEPKLDILNSEEDLFTNTQLSVIDRFILSQQLDEKELMDETFTIFTSSQEASAKIASFMLLMMAFHPNCQEKLYNEILRVIVDKNEPITDDHLKQMTYLDMVFREVLRLFPIGGMLQRTINEDVPINSGTIPAGSSIVIPIYHIHRDSSFWYDPNSFDPERFRPENCQQRPTYSYIPFSLGHMDCLGRYFGTKLIKTIVVKVLQEFKLSSTRSYNDLRIAISISATSLDGYYAILGPRC